MPHWKPMRPDSVIQLQEYYYLLRGQSVRQEYITCMYEWRSLQGGGYTHYLTEGDLLGLPKEKKFLTTKN